MTTTDFGAEARCYEIEEASRAPGSGWRRTPIWLRLLGANAQEYRDGPRDRTHRMKWGELTFGWRGLAFRVGAHETAHLQIACLFFVAFIRLPFLDRALTTGSCSIDNPSYGFSTFEGTIHLDWGRWGRIIEPPWQRRYLFREFLAADGRWLPHDLLWRDYRPDEGVKPLTQALPYHYLLDNGEVQHVTATVHRERGWIVWKWFGESTSPRAHLAPGRRRRKAWLSDGLRAIQKRLTPPRESIDISFSGEVGERAGSWKGGCIGCSYDMKPGEAPVQTLRRMQRERRFR